MRDRHLQELWGWAEALGDAALKEELRAHIPWLQNKPEYEGLKVEVLNQTRLPGHGHSFPARLEFGTDVFWRDHCLHRLDSLQPFGPTLNQGFLVEGRAIGWHKDELVEYDILAGRFGARWFGARWGSTFLVQDAMLLHQPGKSLSCYSLEERRECWNFPGYGRAFWIDEHHIGASAVDKPAVVLELATGQVRAEIPYGGRVTNRGELSLVATRQAWFVMDRGNWEVLYEHPAVEDRTFSGTEPTWWAEGQVEFQGVLWEARSGEELGPSGLEQMGHSYNLHPREPWYRWLREKGLFSLDRAVGLGIWEETLREWEAEHSSRTSGSAKQRSGVTMAMREFGEAVHLLLSAGLDLLHLKLTPVASTESERVKGRSLGELERVLLEEVAPRQVCGPWLRALDDEELRQRLLDRDVLPGPELAASIIARFLGGGSLPNEQLSMLYELFTPETEIRLWQKFLAQTLEGELLKRVVEDLVFHPQGEKLAGLIEPGQVEAESQPVLQSLQGESVSPERLKQCCSWEAWQALEKRIEARSQVEEKGPTSLDLSRSLAEVVQAAAQLESWRTRASAALPALEFEKLQNIGVHSSIVRLSRSADFIMEGGSNFSVWWGGDWWKGKADGGAISPDGSSLARYEGEHLELWHLGQEQPVWRQQIAVSTPRKLVFNATSSLVGISCRGSVSVYRASSGECLFSCRSGSSAFLLGEQCVAAGGKLYRFSEPEAPVRQVCLAIGPEDQIIHMRMRRLLMGDEEICRQGAVLSADAQGFWIQREDGLSLWNRESGLVRVPLENWSQQACQMFASFPEADLIVRDWGVWRRSSGRCLVEPRPVSEKERKALRTFESSQQCGYDARRGRLLLRHPKGPVECYRAMPVGSPEVIDEADLRERIDLTPREEERALWKLILDLKQSL